MNKTFKNFYVKELWDYLSDSFVYWVDRSMGETMVTSVHKDNIDILSKDRHYNNIESKAQIEAIQNKKINNFEEFVVQLEKQNHCKVLHNKTDIFVIDLYLRSSKEQRKLIINNLRFIYYLQNKYNTNFNMLLFCTKLVKRLSYEEFKELWSNIPSSILSIKSTSQIVVEVKKYLDENFTPIQAEELLSIYLINRKNKVVLSENKVIEVRDVILSSFSKEGINKMANYFPAIKMALDLENGESYIRNRHVVENFYIEIDVEMLKSTVLIPGWKSEKYKRILTLLLRNIERKFEEIKSIRSFTENEDNNKKQEYIAIDVYKKTQSGITKDEIIKYIQDFFSDLTNNYASIGFKDTQKQEYVSKWFDYAYLKYKLNKGLPVKEGKRGKI